MSRRSQPPARLLLAGAILLAYHGLFANGQQLLGWDDTANLVENDGYKGLDASHLGWMIQSAHLAVYEPIAWLVKAFEYLAFGVSARAFHVVSLALHLGSTFVVLDIARRLIRRASALAEPAQVETAAVCGALLFGIHPLRVEVVAWASGQSYALAGLFFLLSIAAYLRHAESGREGGSRWLALALAAYAAAGLSKSAAAMLPLVLVVLDLWPLCRWGGRRVVLEKLPFIAVLVGLVVLATLANRAAQVGEPASLNLGQRLARAAQALVLYPRETLWPAGLAAIYPVETSRLSPFAPETLLSVAAIAFAVVLAVRQRREAPWIAAALASYVAVVLPVLGLVQHGALTEAFDRYAYMSTIGLDLVLGVGLARLWHMDARVGRRAVLGVAAVLAAVTVAQTQTWSTTVALWQNALAVTRESAFVLNNLGFEFMGAQRLAEAEPLLARAVALDPRNIKATLNYGVTLERLGRVDQAIVFYVGALRLLPDVAEIHFNLGMLFARKGQFPEARIALERAAALRADWALPRERLATLPRDPPRAP